MAGSGSGSAAPRTQPGTRDLFHGPDSVSPHTCRRTSGGDVVAKIDQQADTLKEGARREGGRRDGFGKRVSINPYFTCPPTLFLYGSDDFVNDEMSILGSIDFGALARVNGGSGSAKRSQHKGRRGGKKRFKHKKESNPVQGGGEQNGDHPPHQGDLPDWHVGGDPRASHCSRGSTAENRPNLLTESGEAGTADGVQRPVSHHGKNLGVESVVISRRKSKAKKKRRQKALKAAVKAQTAQDLCTVVKAEEVADSTTERQRVEPKQEETKRTESPTAAEIRILKTESTADSSKMEAAARPAALVTASNPGTEGQRGVLSVEEELAQLRIKLQKKKVPLSSCDTGSLAEETNEDSAPASKSAEGQSCSERFFTEQQSRQTETPDSTQRKQGYFKRPGMKISAQRMAFVCSVCKFHSFYRKNMTTHLESKFHKDHFKFLSEHLSEPTVDFLQTHFCHKYKKVENFINQIPNHREVVCQLYEDRDLTRDINMEHFMTKAEAAHCLACNVYIPMQHYLIQQHLESPEHDYNCKIMMVQSKKSGLSTAQNILRNRFIRKKLKLCLKDSTVMDRGDVKTEEAWSTEESAVPDAKADTVKQEVEPPYEQMIQAAEPRRDGEDQEVEPLSEGLLPAVEQIKIEVKQEEPEEHYQEDLLFDLLNEEDDVEGVELGEEELGEDDYI